MIPRLAPPLRQQAARIVKPLAVSIGHFCGAEFLCYRTATSSIRWMRLPSPGLFDPARDLFFVGADQRSVEGLFWHPLLASLIVPGGPEKTPGNKHQGVAACPSPLPLTERWDRSRRGVGPSIPAPMPRWGGVLGGLSIIASSTARGRRPRICARL